MIRPPPRRLLRASLISALLVPALALGQEGGFGLDLSSDAPAAESPQPKKQRRGKKKDAAPAPGEESLPAPSAPPDAPNPPAPTSPPPDAPAAGLDLGMDLTADANGADLRPTLAIVGVGHAVPSPSRSDASLAQRSAASLVAAATRVPTFLQVLTPEQVRQKLGDGYEAALRCDDVGCLERLATALEVERVITAQLSRSGENATVTLRGLTRNLATLEEGDATSDGTPGAAFQRKLSGAVVPILESLSTHLAQVKILTGQDQARVTLDNSRDLGTGSGERTIPSGHHVIEVKAPGFRTFTEEITLPPDGRIEVLARLDPGEAVAERTEVPAAAIARPSGPTIFSKPGTYVTLVGLVAAGVGAYLGSQSQAVAARAIDANGDGVLDVTRAELIQAQQTAGLANVLMGVGGAAAAGGVLWVILTPSPATPAPSLSPSSPGGAAGARLGFTLGLGGNLP